MSTLRASLLALFVTLLWSSCWVLIRVGLTSLDPLAFAGMRYGLAGLLLGAGVLLGVGVPLDGLPELDVTAGLFVVWLAVVDTAIAFTLWNRSLRWPTATAAATSNDTMLVQIAVLAWVVLGEALTGAEVVGLVTVAAGTLVVQPAAARRPVSGPASPR